jgi:hypothetical protein
MNWEKVISLWVEQSQHRTLMDQAITEVYMLALFLDGTWDSAQYARDFHECQIAQKTCQ